MAIEIRCTIDDRGSGIEFRPHFMSISYQVPKVYMPSDEEELSSDSEDDN